MTDGEAEPLGGTADCPDCSEEAEPAEAPCVELSVVTGMLVNPPNTEGVDSAAPSLGENRPVGILDWTDS